MSASKKDRTTAPRVGTRPSKAKHADDRNVKPPAGYKPAGKLKPGERAMKAQLGERADLCQNPRCGHAHEVHDLEDACSECDCRAWTPSGEVPAGVPSRSGIEGDPLAPSSSPAAPANLRGAAGAVVLADPDQAPPKDPWWTDEREKAFAMVLQGVPQHQVAGELGRDRHTVGRWMEDERFETRLYDENVARFKASRQRRSVQTLRLTDKAERLAGKMLDKAIDLADKGEDQLGVRLAARDWLQEFRENSRREDEIFGLAKERVDVNVHGQVQHTHKGKVGVTFKAFLETSLRGMGIDPEKEEVDASRADEAIATIAERALMEGSFLEDLVEREKKQQLAPALAADR